MLRKILTGTIIRVTSQICSILALIILSQILTPNDLGYYSQIISISVLTALPATIGLQRLLITEWSGIERTNDLRARNILIPSDLLFTAVFMGLVFFSFVVSMQQTIDVWPLFCQYS